MILVCTPFKKNPLLAHVDSPMPIVQQSPRRSRRISQSDDELNLKRVKMLSTEVKSHSPAPRRRTRASSAEPSDDEAVVFVSESNPNSRAARMKQRQSVIASPTVDLIAEDDELNISNELELRNRSISKSPASVYLSPKLTNIIGMKGCSVVVSKCLIDESDNTEIKLKEEVPSPNNSNAQEIFAVSESNEEIVLPLSQFVKDKIMEVEPTMSPSQITPRARLSITETQKNGIKETDAENGNSGVKSTFSPEMFSDDEAEFHEAENVNSIIDRITSPKPSTPKSKTSTPATNGTPSRLLKPVNSDEVIDNSQPTTSLAIQGRRSYRERSLAAKEQSFSEMEGSPVRNKKASLALSNSPLINFNTPIKNVVQEITIEKEKTPLAQKTPLKIVDATPVKSSSTPMKISSSETPGKFKETKSMDISKESNDSDMDITLLSLKKKGISKTPQPRKVETVSKTLSKSWSQAVEASSTKNIESIDRFSTTLETKTVIKSKTPSKLIDTDNESENENDDEDEDQVSKERSDFVLDEVEEGEEDSMDSSERNYVKDNEIVEEGEDLGSDDTDGDEEDEEDEDDSFIASDGPEIDDQYSLDSDEEVIELRKSRTKRQSRIINMPDSSDEEVVLEKSPVKTPRKSLAKKSPEVLIEKDDISSKKRKREDKLDDSVVVNTKRAKLSETIVDATDDSYESSDYEDALEKSVELDVNTTLKTPSKKQKEQTPKKSAKKETPMEVEEMQQDDEITEKKKKVKKAKTTVADIDTIINKCNSILSKSEQEKKANKALKKIRKTEEKRLKLSLKQTSDSANTSTENKENTLKKKKYKKNLKQKAVEDVNDFKKEDMAASLSKFSEKLERKRLRKAEKKLEKKAQLELYADTQVLNVEVAEPVVKADKKVKHLNIDLFIDFN